MHIISRLFLSSPRMRLLSELASWSYAWPFIRRSVRMSFLTRFARALANCHSLPTTTNVQSMDSDSDFDNFIVTKHPSLDKENQQAQRDCVALAKTGIGTMDSILDCSKKLNPWISIGLAVK